MCRAARHKRTCRARVSAQPARTCVDDFVDIAGGAVRHPVVVRAVRVLSRLLIAVKEVLALEESTLRALLQVQVHLQPVQPGMVVAPEFVRQGETFKGWRDV